MAESEKLETLVYCLGPVGGKLNNVITGGSGFFSKLDYTKWGYARYIEEANNVIKFQNLVINYFMESVQSEFEEDPLAFIDSENEVETLASIHKMKKHWKDMFKEHQAELREALKNPNEAQASEDMSDESSASSSAKIPRLDTDGSSESSEKTPKSNPETGDKHTKSDKEATPEAASVGVPVEDVEFPLSIFQRKLKEFGKILKAEFLELKERMGKALERFSNKESEVKDLKGFVFYKMAKFAKWKYALKTLSLLLPELQKKLNELDLDFYKKKENEKRLTDWLYFDDGKRDRKYHHRLLITIELAGPIEEVSALIFKQLRRYDSLTKSLKMKLTSESEAFEEKVKKIQYEILYHRPPRALGKPQKSTDSGDTLYNIDDMPEET